ncbi:GNAT family N-acetyltransferase [Pseudonocardia nematodicida]|uniref:GNAT family N-acetyltransferase n=1 Tax=Pseudonocardia nematodicida TaxID=1206997 RepID=A0ABV1K5H1_9PSEU
MPPPDAALDALLQNPVPSALRGPLRDFGTVRGGAAVFAADVSPFAGLPPGPTAGDWAHLTALCEPGRQLALVHAGERAPALPAGWERVLELPGVQMDGGGVTGEPDDEAVVLGPGDRAEMADLADRTRPGPWLARTAELGTFLGIRHDGRLIAMAGERLRFDAGPGARAREISAVCTDPEFRGKGLAGRLVRAVAAGMLARGERPLLHASAANTGAIRLYRALGFTEARAMRFELLRTPER